MRTPLVAAALAVLAFSAPAAAQPNPVTVVNDAMRQMAANTENIDDYTLTLSNGPLSAPVYVYRDGGEWSVASPEDIPVAELFASMVAWPTFAELGFPADDEVTAEDLEMFADVFGLTSATIDGRRAHVVFVRTDLLMPDETEMPDSVRLFVDQQSRQLLRVQVSGAGGGAMDLPGAVGSVDATMSFSDYRETDGLTVPRRLSMEMRMVLKLTDEQKEALQSVITEARAELEGDTSEEGRQAAAMMDIVMSLFTEGRLALSVNVTDVQVNTGPPDWFEGF